MSEFELSEFELSRPLDGSGSVRSPPSGSDREANRTSSSWRGGVAGAPRLPRLSPNLGSSSEPRSRARLLDDGDASVVFDARNDPSVATTSPSSHAQIPERSTSASSNDSARGRSRPAKAHGCLATSSPSPSSRPSAVSRHSTRNARSAGSMEGARGGATARDMMRMGIGDGSHARPARGATMSATDGPREWQLRSCASRCSRQ